MDATMRLAMWAMGRVGLHRDRMRTDSDYRHGIESLIKWLSSRPGRCGEVAGVVGDLHPILLKLF